MSVSLLQPSFLMSKTRSYAQILIGSRLFLTAMAIHLSLRVAPLDLQQGGNSRIPYVHVPAARMSILVYITTALNTFFFLLTKHPLFLRSSGTGTEMGAFSTLFTLVTGGFRGRPMWGTFWVWDARLTSVFISFLIYLGALFFQKLSVEPAPISIRAGLIDIPIIKSSVNWWNTSHQPGSISRSDISIHLSMPIPILSNFANSPLSTPILFVLETRLPIPSFLESPLKEEIEAREATPKPIHSLSLFASMAEWFNSYWMHLLRKNHVLRSSLFPFPSQGLGYLGSYLPRKVIAQRTCLLGAFYLRLLFNFDFEDHSISKAGNDMESYLEGYGNQEVFCPMGSESSRLRELERMRIPGGFQLERLVELLEEDREPAKVLFYLPLRVIPYSKKAEVRSGEWDGSTRPRCQCKVVLRNVGIACDKEYRRKLLSRVESPNEHYESVCSCLLFGKAGPVSPSLISISPDRLLSE
ncbi:cytochrome c biogenesis C [Striga asiatica]|uniref:Cytochrome c biogenesis C n=1 Tax=Striga asiatica TaxID=4170 RepID=A0A5A7QMF1_STRAF|nr:cytochrome c biogenesis C [Striga asiatica]